MYLKIFLVKVKQIETFKGPETTSWAADVRAVAECLWY